jgi:hypothetical protein
MSMENQTDEHAMVTMTAGSVKATEPLPLKVTPRFIEDTKSSLSLLQSMVRDVLVDGRDYGHVTGIPGKFLWDPGASQIIGAFNCFAGHRRVLSLIDDGEKIAAVIEVPLIQRGSQQEVGSGIGASSTMEVKHKYRWVKNPREWGYDGEAIKALKTKETKEGGDLEYRIPNPEHDELLNTIIKQASKRAEVDAAEALPGVAAVLREMFGAGGAGEQAGPRWTKFWSAVKALLPNAGDYQAEAHRLLGVKTMKDWISAGRSLDDALRKLSEVVKIKPPASQERRDPATVKEAELDGAMALQRIMNACFGWQPARVWAEANYRNQQDFEEGGTETAWELFQRLAPIALDQERPPQGS